MTLRRLAVLVAMAFTVPGAGSALALSPSVVVEVESGRVLMAEDATTPWYPASVTKLMTVYVALHQLKAGKIGLETPIAVSRRAASMPPSKIGVRPGQEVTLDNAMKMLLVKSANDMAVVIAEGVGGSVEAFADMMNAEATRIGMRESHFINPNGLWVEGQQTSARDMALLARQILVEFPDFASYFRIGSVQLGGRILKNTNGLIGRYPGIEGMKTGFICPSGFNLVAVARRGGQRLIAVVFGAPSNAERTLRAAELLDKGFASWGGGIGTLETLPSSPVAAPPNMREDICVRHKGAAPSEEEAEPTVVATTKEEDGALVRPGAMAVMQVGNGVRGVGRSLAPRAELDVWPVVLGRTPGSAIAPLAANAAGGTAATATAYANDKKTLDGSEADEAAPGVKVKPQATQLPLSPAAAATIGKGRSKAGSGLGAIPAKSAKAEPSASPPPTVAKDTAAKPGHAVPAAKAAKAKPKPAAKPVAHAAPAKAKPHAKPAPKPAPKVEADPG